MSFDKYHEEIVDHWQICIDNTNLPDVDCCDFIEECPTKI